MEDSAYSQRRLEELQALVGNIPDSNARKVKFRLHNKTLIAAVLLLSCQLCLAPAHAQVEVGENDFRISFSSTLATNPDAAEAAEAYNPTEDEFLVVWSATTVVISGFEFIDRQVILRKKVGASVSGITGSLVSTSSTSGRRAISPAIVYNSVEDEFLVVWAEDDGDGLVSSEYEIFGQILSSSYAPIGGNFRISDVGGTGDNNFDANDPAVAFNSVENEYLVVWDGDDNSGKSIEGENEIHGQRLNENGTALGNNDFRISDMGGTGAQELGAYKPAVAFNSVENEYLVVWDGDDSSGGLVNNEIEIFGQRLNENGTAQGNDDFRISDMGGTGDEAFGAYNPAVAFNSVENEYLVVWFGDDDDGALVDNENEIFGQRLNENGTAQGTNDFRISDMGGTGDNPFDARSPAVAFNSVENEYLVVWYGDDNTGGLVDNENEIFGQRLNEYGTAQGTNDFRISDMGGTGDNPFDAFDPAVAFNPTRSQALVVWYGDDDEGGLQNQDFEIFGQRLDMPLFADGFEFGNTSAWSASVP